MTHVELAAHLIDHLDSDRFPEVLEKAVAERVRFQNFIGYAYYQGFSADLVHSNLPREPLLQHMAPYINGLYLLDPFYVADAAAGRRGLMTLAEVAPEDFRESEFYLRFYVAVNMLDEAHVVMPLEAGRSVHLFVERESPQPRSTPPTSPRCARSSRWWPAPCAWRDARQRASAPLPIDSVGGIDGLIRKMRPGQLTPREVEVIGLSLRGHSSKLIAHALGISEGTVTNHKRNVYEKLAIHSQSQLFSLFLAALADDRSTA